MSLKTVYMGEGVTCVCLGVWGVKNQEKNANIVYEWSFSQNDGKGYVWEIYGKLERKMRIHIHLGLISYVRRSHYWQLEQLIIGNLILPLVKKNWWVFTCYQEYNASTFYILNIFSLSNKNYKKNWLSFILYSFVGFCLQICMLLYQK